MVYNYVVVKSKIILNAEENYMRLTKRIFAFASAAISATAMLFCGDANAGSITVTDMAGNDITLSAPAEKIVALNPADCEILYAIGAGDFLTARGENCNYPEEILPIKPVGVGDHLSIEELIAAGPTLVLVSGGQLTNEQTEQLRNAGITTAVSDAHDVDGIYESITMIGELTGKANVSEYVLTAMRSTFKILDAAVSAREGEPETVYFEVSSADGLETAGSGTLLDSAASMAGLKNIFEDMEGYAQVTEEQVIERNPDHIVTVKLYQDEEPAGMQVLARPGWENITAVQNESVLSLSSGELITPSPRFPDDVSILFNFAYGDENPEALMGPQW